jgi:YfiH family protein
MKPDCIRPDWPAPANIQAFTTTRSGGVSKGPWSAFNLGNRCGDHSAHVAQNRENLNDMLPCAVSWLQQVHGTRVVQFSSDSIAEPIADAAVSFTPGQVCAVLTADCLPVFFCNRRGDRIGVAHAGWRGLAQGVLQATVDALDEDPSQLMAWLGPAIGPGAYEVGVELAKAFADEFPTGFTRSGERYLLDLYTLARLKLNGVGVNNVGGGGFCTLSEPQRFFSYRRDGNTGRMASVIWFNHPEHIASSSR